MGHIKILLYILLGLLSSATFASEQEQVIALINKHQNHHSHFKDLLNKLENGSVTKSDGSYFPLPQIDVNENGDIILGSKVIALKDDVLPDLGGQPLSDQEIADILKAGGTSRPSSKDQSQSSSTGTLARSSATSSGTVVLIPNGGSSGKGPSAQGKSKGKDQSDSSDGGSASGTSVTVATSSSSTSSQQVPLINTPAAPGLGSVVNPKNEEEEVDISVAETQMGTSTDSDSVATSEELTGGDDQLYMAAVAVRDADVSVSEMTGLGLNWTKVKEQCAASSEVGIEVWYAIGEATSSAVSVTLSDSASSAGIIVHRLEGVDPSAPLGAMVSANTNGAGEEADCSIGIAEKTYQYDLQSSSESSLTLNFMAVTGLSNSHTSQGEELIDHFFGNNALSFLNISSTARASNGGLLSVEGSFNQSRRWTGIAVEIKN